MLIEKDADDVQGVAHAARRVAGEDAGARRGSSSVDGEQAVDCGRLQCRSQVGAHDGGFERQQREGHAEVLAGVM
jgi:hypothetical protein